MEKFISFVLPCLNEEKGIGVCIDKIKRVIDDLQVEAEIIIVDNGCIDKSPQIAREKGAKIVYQAQKGYGAAYLKGMREAKGDFIIMGDADDTYDFLESPRFIKALQEGYDLVMGSRFQGKILPGAMPFLNRVGNRILSGIVKVFFKTNLSDIHCGFRALTKEAFVKMKLKSPGMEFASEMVISALRENLQIKQVPISYYPRKGDSKLARFRDGWRHIRFILLYAPSWLYLVPGGILFSVGVLLLSLLVQGPVKILFRVWDIHLMVLASLFTLLGFQTISLGVLAKTYGLRNGLIKKDRFFNIFLRHMSLEKGLLAGAIFFLIGFVINIFVFAEWVAHNFGPLAKVREALFGITFIMLGIQIIFSSFFFSLLKEKR
jgi:glycosyltransferase involved in cell wall biosynthesis